MTIEEKKAELIEAGYKVAFNEYDSYAYARTPDEEWECISFPEMPINRPSQEVDANVDASLVEVTETAYAHLTEKKRLAELEDFVKEILGTTEKSLFKAKGANPDLINSQVLAIAISFDYKDIERMKRLVGKDES